MERWTEDSLGQLCDIYQPKTISKKEMNPQGIYPVFGANGIIGRYDKYNHDDPQLLITCRGATCGSVNISESKSWITGNAMVVRPKVEELSLRFLEYLFRGGLNLSSVISGAAQPQITRKSLAPVRISYPPLLEQEQIVAILDEAFAAIATATANAEKNLANARELFERELDRTFSRSDVDWAKTTLEECLRVQPRNGWSPPAAHHADSGVPVLTLSSVTGFHFRGECVKYTSAPTDRERHYWIRNGDFLMTRSNTPELVGHVAIANGIAEPTIYPDLIMRMNPDESLLLTQFLYFQMRTRRLRDEITERAKGANPTMKKVNKKSVQTLPIALAPLEAQRTISSHLSDMYERTLILERMEQKKLTALTELKQSILHKAFTGELTADSKATDRTLSEAGI